MKSELKRVASFDNLHTDDLLKNQKPLLLKQRKMSIDIPSIARKIKLFMDSQRTIIMFHSQNVS